MAMYGLSPLPPPAEVLLLPLSDDEPQALSARAIAVAATTAPNRLVCIWIKLPWLRVDLIGGASGLRGSEDGVLQAARLRAMSA
jgi:hypothetical protein